MPEAKRNPHFQRLTIDCELKNSNGIARVFQISNLIGANYIGIYNGKIGFFKSADCCRPIHICRRGKRKKIRRRFYKIEKGKEAVSVPTYLFGRVRLENGHHYGPPVFYEVVSDLESPFELIEIPVFDNRRIKEMAR